MCRFLTYEIHQLFDDAVSASLVADFIELVAKFFFGYQAHIGKVDPRAASFAEQHPQRFVCQHMKEGDGEIL